MGAIPRPADFEPLASSDPVPGNTDEIAALGRRYTDTAAEIEAQAANLRKLAAGTIEGWTGQAAKVFQSHAADLATRISQAQQRYATAGKALTGCAGPMYTAQQSAYAAVAKAKAAQQTMQANAPGPKPPPGSKPPTAEQQAAAAKAATAYGDATTDLKNATTQFHNAVKDYQDAANSAAKAIENEINHDSLKDSWWDRNFGWISKVFMVIGIVVLVLAVVALILVCPFTAAFLVELLAMVGVEATTATLAAIGGALGWVIAGATVLQAIYDGTAAATGKESWTSFTIDLVSLATLGLGEGLGAVTRTVTDANGATKVITYLPELKGLTPRLLESLSEGAEGAAKSVAAGRAGRAAMASQGLPGFVYSLGSRIEPVASPLLKAFGQGGKLENAMEAASGARESIETLVKGAEPSTAVTLLTMGGTESATEYAKLVALNDEVPGVVRIIVPKVAAGSLVGIDGVVQWSTFAGGNAYMVHSDLQGDGSASINQTIGQFRQMESRVPA